MTAALPAVRPQVTLGTALLAHLEDQLASTGRLLGHVLRQTTAIRDRDVDTVLAAIADIQGEMERRAALERVRGELLAHAAGRLGLPAHTVTLDAMCTLIAPPEAVTAREHSAQLRGLLAEVGRQHQANRLLMKQELAFLEHLTRQLGGEEHGGYAPGGVTTAPMHPSAHRPHRVLDLKA
jgi:hypothetical protein